MRIFLAGVSCVGKTTLGARLAGCLECRFFDLDVEIERFFGTSIERLRSGHPAQDDFRRLAAQALKHLLSRDESRNCVIALPPSGLLDGCWKVVKGTRDAIIVALRDSPQDILDRITFYDIDSNPVRKHLTDSDKRFYLREIRRDIAYYRRSFAKAHMSVDVTGCNADEALHKVQDALARARSDNGSEAPNGALHDACPSPV